MSGGVGGEGPGSPALPYPDSALSLETLERFLFIVVPQNAENLLSKEVDLPCPDSTDRSQGLEGPRCRPHDCRDLPV